MELRAQTWHIATSIMICALGLTHCASNSLPQTSSVVRSSEKCSSFPGVVSANASSAWEVEELRVGARESLRRIHFVDERNGWVTGTRKLYRTNDGGATWKELNLKVPDKFRIHTIRFVNRLIGFVTLERFEYPYDRMSLQLMHTDDGGETWQLRLRLKETFGGDIFFSDERHGWLIGNSYRYPREFYGPLVLRTSDQGRTWADVSGVLIKTYRAHHTGYWSALTGIAVKSASAITVSTTAGDLFTTDDGGRNWAEVESPCANPGWGSPGSILGLLGGKHLWMAEGADGLEGYWGVVYSPQNEDRWIRYTLPSFALRDATYISQSQALVVGSKIDGSGGRRSGAVLYSSDGGRTWEVIYHNAAIGTISAITHSGSHHLWAVGEHGLILRLKFSAKVTGAS